MDYMLWDICRTNRCHNRIPLCLYGRIQTQGEGCDAGGDRHGHTCLDNTQGTSKCTDRVDSEHSIIRHNPTKERIEKRFNASSGGMWNSDWQVICTYSSVWSSSYACESVSQTTWYYVGRRVSWFSWLAREIKEEWYCAEWSALFLLGEFIP